MQVKYFSKDLLVKANKTAIRTNRNRSLEPKYLSQLDEDNKYPIVWAMPHNDVEMRVRLLLNADDDAWLDICLLYTSPSPRDGLLSRMPSSA